MSKGGHHAKIDLVIRANFCALRRVPPFWSQVSWSHSLLMANIGYSSHDNEQEDVNLLLKRILEAMEGLMGAFN